MTQFLQTVGFTLLALSIGWLLGCLKKYNDLTKDKDFKSDSANGRSSTERVAIHGLLGFVLLMVSMQLISMMAQEQAMAAKAAKDSLMLEQVVKAQTAQAASQTASSKARVQPPLSGRPTARPERGRLTNF